MQRDGHAAHRPAELWHHLKRAISLPPPSAQLTYAEFAALETTGEVQKRIRALGELFAYLVTADEAAEAAGQGRAAPPPHSFAQLVDRKHKPRIELRVAAEQYDFTCNGSEGSDAPRQCEEFRWSLTGASAPSQSTLTQLTFCAADTSHRNAIAPALRHTAKKFGGDLVSAGRTSIEMAAIGEELPFTIDKTAAANLLDLHAHEIVDGPDAARCNRGGTCLVDPRTPFTPDSLAGPLVILDMDGTVTRKDKHHDNTRENNLAYSRAILQIKACLRGDRGRPPGIVAINSGNKAMLQIQRILAAFRPAPADIQLVRRLLLVAQGGTVAYRFMPGPREDRLVVQQVQEWEGWYGSMVRDMTRSTIAEHDEHAPLYCDDELGGNESRYKFQLQVHVPNTDTDNERTSLEEVERGPSVIKASVRQDKGTGLAIQSFLEASSPRTRNRRALRSGPTGLTPEDLVEAMELALEGDLDRVAFSRSISLSPGTLPTLPGQ